MTITTQTALTEKALQALLILASEDEETTTPEALEECLWRMVNTFCPDLTNQQFQMEYDRQQAITTKIIEKYEIHIGETVKEPGDIIEVLKKILSQLKIDSSEIEIEYSLEEQCTNE